MVTILLEATEVVNTEAWVAHSVILGSGSGSEHQIMSQNMLGIFEVYCQDTGAYLEIL